MNINENKPGFLCQPKASLKEWAGSAAPQGSLILVAGEGSAPQFSCVIKCVTWHEGELELIIVWCLAV